MILDRYFARRFIQSFLVIGAIFLTLMILIDLIEQLRRFGEVNLSFGQLLQLTLLNTPAAISEMLPLLMILSTIALFVGLARSSELVVTRAIGRSGIRALAAPATVALLVGCLAVAFLNPIAAATSEKYRNMSDLYKNGGSSTLSISRDGLWLRQGSAQGQSVINARSTTSGETLELRDVTIITFGPEGIPNRQIVARRAMLEDGNWVLRDAKDWSLADGENPETQATKHQTLRLATTLTRDRILDTLGQRDSVSVYDLPQLIRDLREAGFSTKQYEVWMHVQLARPLFLVSMVLIGAAFTMRHVRFGGTGIAVLSAVLLGFAIYFIRNFAQILGESGQIPVLLAAWGPPVASILLPLGLLLHLVPPAGDVLQGEQAPLQPRVVVRHHAGLPLGPLGRGVVAGHRLEAVEVVLAVVHAVVQRRVVVVAEHDAVEGRVLCRGRDLLDHLLAPLGQALGVADAEHDAPAAPPAMNSIACSTACTAAAGKA